MGLEFSSEQEQVASIFTAYRNDIDIYTEDENKDKPFYKKLFIRLLKIQGLIFMMYILWGPQMMLLRLAKKIMMLLERKYT